MIAVLCGAVAGLGLILIVAGFVRPDPLTVPRQRRPPLLTARRVIPVASGTVIGALVLIASTWPAAAVGSGVLVGVVAASFAARTEQPRVLEARLEAIATWCEQLRDLLRAGALLYPAIATTASTCPAVIRPAVTTLAARLEREHPGSALRRLADELDDPTGDLVASVLLTATSHAGNTAELLSELADLTRQRVERRKHIEAERATTRMDMRIILGVCTVTILAMVLFANSQFLRPYRTGEGQLVLTVIFAVYVAAVSWARRIATYQRPDRFLTIDGHQ